MPDYRRYASASGTRTAETTGGPATALDGDTVVDVAIVGAGYTGLWTAYWLTELAPGTRIAIVEQEVAGFGASGRNGGFCSALFPTSLRRLAKGSTPRSGDRVAADDERRGRAHRRGPDARGHRLRFPARRLSVRGPQPRPSSPGCAPASRTSGVGFRRRARPGAERAEVAERVRMSDALGGLFSPNCAAVHPAKLVRGLAECVERRGVKIYERTRATTIAPRVVATDRGTVRADVVIRATEGYTPEFAGAHRDIVPMYSLMVATEPLDPALWEQIGLARERPSATAGTCGSTGSAPPTGDFAFGGRGAPYHYGSRVSPDFDTDARVHAMLRRILTELFPAVRDVAFTHAWGGNLAIPRDWYPSVNLRQGNGFRVRRWLRR